MNKEKIALCYEDGNVFQHFGHTENFKVYELEDGAIKNTLILNANGSGHGALADFLKNENVDTLICGGIGDGAKQALSAAGIRLFPGVSGNADQAVADFLAGKLDFNPDTQCNHSSEDHGRHEHAEGGHCKGHCHTDQ